MIHHLSVAVENPAHVATVLAEIWQGQALPFPVAPNSYVVFADNNDQGVCLEICPLGYELVPGEMEVQFKQNGTAWPFTATHAAISVPIGLEQIQAIADREGWQAQLCDRGPGCFQLVEFWVENHLLLELLTPEMAQQYSQFMTPQNWNTFLAEATRT
jgi:hypothetical protein